MKRPPRNVNEHILNRNLFITLVLRAMVVCAWVLPIFYLYSDPNSPLAVIDISYEDAADKIPWLYEYAQRRVGLTPHEETWNLIYLEFKARSVVFLIVMTSVTANVYNCRTEDSIRTVQFFGNKYLNYSVLLSIGLIVAAFWPGSALGAIFYIIPLDYELLLVIPTIIISIVPIELLKKYLKR